MYRNIATPGTENGQFMHPHGVAVDSKGNVFVSDRDKANIRKFTADGKFITKLGSEGSADGQFSNPESITVDSLSYLYVADTDNNNVQLFISN